MMSQSRAADPHLTLVILHQEIHFNSLGKILHGKRPSAFIHPVNYCVGGLIEVWKNTLLGHPVLYFPIIGYSGHEPVGLHPRQQGKINPVGQEGAAHQRRQEDPADPQHRSLFSSHCNPSLVDLGYGNPAGQIVLKIEKQQQDRDGRQHTAGAQHPHVPLAHLGQEYGQGVVVGVIQVNQRLLHHVPGVNKGQEHQGRQPGTAPGNQDPEQNPQIARTVKLCRFQIFAGAGVKNLPHEEHPERRENPWQDQGQPVAQQPHFVQNHVIGNQRYLVGHHHDDNYNEKQNFLPREPEPGKAEPCQAGNQRLACHNGRAQGQGVPEFHQVMGPPQEHFPVSLQTEGGGEQAVGCAVRKGIQQGIGKGQQGKGSQENQKRQPPLRDFFLFHGKSPFTKSLPPAFSAGTAAGPGRKLRRRSGWPPLTGGCSSGCGNCC